MHEYNSKDISCPEKPHLKAESIVAYELVKVM